MAPMIVEEVAFQEAVKPLKDWYKAHAPDLLPQTEKAGPHAPHFDGPSAPTPEEIAQAERS